MLTIQICIKYKLGLYVLLVLLHEIHCCSARNAGKNRETEGRLMKGHKMLETHRSPEKFECVRSDADKTSEGTLGGDHGSLGKEKEPPEAPDKEKHEEKQKKNVNKVEQKQEPTESPSPAAINEKVKKGQKVLESLKFSNNQNAEKAKERTKKEKKNQDEEKQEVTDTASTSDGSLKKEMNMKIKEETENPSEVVNKRLKRGHRVRKNRAANKQIPPETDAAYRAGAEATTDADDDETTSAAEVDSATAATVTSMSAGYPFS